MKKYQQPSIEIMLISLKDVLAASGDVLSENEENFGDLSGWIS